MIRRTATLAILGASLLAAAGTVDAARGGNGGGNGATATATVFHMDQPAPISYGQAITFTVSTAATDRPMSNVMCYQDGFHVYHSTRGHFQDYYDYFGEPVHYLSSLSWVGGAADCTASLISQGKNGRMRTLASFDFSVSG